MGYSVQVEFVTPLPKAQINKFMDKTVYNAARITLDMTQGHFPKLTGELERGSYSKGVVGSDKNYDLGTTVDYAKYVWKMGQNTNWTNKNTLAQWYATTFKNKREAIMKQAVTNAKGGL